MASRSSYPGADNALKMRNEQRIYNGFASLRLLLRLIILLGIFHQCCAINDDSIESCSQDAATPPHNCSGGFYSVMIRDCPKYFCYRLLGDICYPDDDTTKCAPGQACSCNKCMNCIGDKCHVELCPSYNLYVSKRRLPNRWLPWIYRGRMQNLPHKFVEPNYDN